MFWFTVETETYTLRAKPITDEDGSPNLFVELSKLTGELPDGQKTLQAVIDADLFVDWLTTQLIWSQFVGDRPGVKIVKFVD